MREWVKITLLFAAAAFVWGYVVSGWLSERAAATRPPENKPSPPPSDCRSPEKYGGELIAVSYENERAAGTALHGDIFLNGHCYHFTTGGVTTSAPFGRYSIGLAARRPYLNTLNSRHTAYPVSDAYDPVLKRVRTELFIHPGRRTEGCIGIDPRQWESFERDMEAAQPRTLNLVAGQTRFQVQMVAR